MTRASASQCLVSSSPDGRIFVQYDINRNARQHGSEFGFVAECVEERAVFHLGEDLRSNSSSHIYSTDGHCAQCEIPGLGAISFCPEIHGFDANAARVRACIVADLPRGIAAGAIKRWMTYLTIQKIVDGTNTTARKNVLATDLRQTLF